MVNVMLVVQYDGTDFNGWQIQTKQPASRTVQFEVEQALKKITQENIRVNAVGRTDAGVHARQQVVSFTTNASVPVQRYPHALNGILPGDVVVTSSKAVAGDFHAQYSVRQKTYAYRVLNCRYPDVFLRRYAYHVSWQLDHLAMADAARYLMGEHDFRAFCASGSSVTDYVRQVTQCQVDKVDHLITISVTANGFLYNMVRIIAGTLLEVGSGRRSVASLADTIAVRQRSAAGPTAPARGLTLEEVIY